MVTNTRKYADQWRKKNPDRVRKYLHTWRKKNPDYQRQWRRKNAEKVLKYQRKWRKENPNKEAAKSYSIKHKYGITLAQYNQILEAQQFKCGACQEDLRLMPSKNIHVDHCHNTKAIRGILCSNCNWAVGLLGDSAKKADLMAVYLRKAPTLLPSSRPTSSRSGRR